MAHRHIFKIAGGSAGPEAANHNFFMLLQFRASWLQGVPKFSGPLASALQGQLQSFGCLFRKCCFLLYTAH